MNLIFVRGRPATTLQNLKIGTNGRSYLPKKFEPRLEQEPLLLETILRLSVFLPRKIGRGLAQTAGRGRGY
jgi:hypothetical protein